MKFSEIKNRIKNNSLFNTYRDKHGFNSLKEVKQAGYRIVKERDGDRYFIARQEELKPLLVRLGDIAEVRRGFTTGANEFFYLDEEKIKEWMIEEEYLKPVIKSPRECKSIIINPKDLKHKVFMCHKSKAELKGTNALKYIEWGEKQEYHKRPSCSGRQRWWDLREKKISQSFCMMSYNDRHIFWKNNSSLVDARLYDIYFNGKVDKLIISLNSFISFLSVELNGRANLGEGALDFKVYEAEKILILSPNEIKGEFAIKRPIKSIFAELGINPNLPIREQKPNPLPDRKALDDIVFDILGLTEDERNEVYWSVTELVANRLKKAKSI